MKLRLALFAVLVLFAAASSASAATSTTSLSISANVAANCTISQGNGLSFGDYTGSQLQTTGSLSVTCTSGTTYTIGLSQGSGPSTSNRKLRQNVSQSPSFLEYALYYDSGMTQNWGDVTDSSPNLYSGTGNGQAQSVTAYGVVAAGQSGLGTGSYSDTLTATITY